MLKANEGNQEREQTGKNQRFLLVLAGMIVPRVLLAITVLSLLPGSANVPPFLMY